MKRTLAAVEILAKYSGEIISSKGMQLERSFMQHGNISCFEHSVKVAYISVLVALKLNIKADMRSLVRGALLHDYFLYDWHVPNKNNRLHAFIHAGRALNNAIQDFELNDKERDIIKKHMFPVNITPFRYKESAIVSIADKLCAFCETFSVKMPSVDLLLVPASRKTPKL